MVYKDSAGKEIHEGDSLMDLTPGFVGEILVSIHTPTQGVTGWSVYEPDEVTELTPSQAIDFHDCLEELSEVDIRFNVNGHSIENGSIRLSYNIYEHNIMVTRVWLNGKESKELLDTIQQWLDNNQE